MGDTLTVCVQCLDGWKIFVVAIGNNNIPHIQVLNQVELWSGAGVFGLSNKIDQASALNYPPQSYEEAHCQRAMAYLTLIQPLPPSLPIFAGFTLTLFKIAKLTLIESTYIKQF
jgi:hypothetical protein